MIVIISHTKKLMNRQSFARVVTGKYQNIKIDFRSEEGLLQWPLNHYNLSVVKIDLIRRLCPCILILMNVMNFDEFPLAKL